MALLSRAEQHGLAHAGSRPFCPGLKRASQAEGPEEGKEGGEEAEIVEKRWDLRAAKTDGKEMMSRGCVPKVHFPSDR